MSRNKLYDVGLLGQLRFCTTKSELLDMTTALMTLDTICRRASSIKTFALRLDYIPSRQEAVLLLAALRHEATDRADNAILALLRRVMPEIERGKWILLSEDHRGFTSCDSVFTEYSIASEADALAEMLRLQSARGWHCDALLSTKATPIAFNKAGADN